VIRPARRQAALPDIFRTYDLRPVQVNKVRYPASRIPHNSGLSLLIESAELAARYEWRTRTFI
jgi:hypothetical protein